MRTMKKSKMICAAVLTGVLGAAALAGCAQEMADTGATYNPGEPPLMTASHGGPLREPRRGRLLRLPRRQRRGGGVPGGRHAAACRPLCGRGCVHP